jgi:hypothetical protein
MHRNTKSNPRQRAPSVGKNAGRDYSVFMKQNRRRFSGKRGG